VRAWRGVTDAVHKRGSRIFAQLWHTGALSHPDFFRRRAADVCLRRRSSKA
jgi:2,4-dienoyl-CoA reductase-like NADH-dependent reductase (Old Yellow Enzyme family)